MVEHTIDLISKEPTLYALTDFRVGLRRCVVVKQVSLYYQVNNTDIVIYIVRLLDNHQNPDKVQDKLGNTNDYYIADNALSSKGFGQLASFLSLGRHKNSTDQYNYKLLKNNLHENF